MNPCLFDRCAQLFELSVYVALRLWLSIRLWPAFFRLQNRLNELGQDLAIRIEQW